MQESTFICLVGPVSLKQFSFLTDPNKLVFFRVAESNFTGFVGPLYFYLCFMLLLGCIFKLLVLLVLVGLFYAFSCFFMLFCAFLCFWYV